MVMTMYNKRCQTPYQRNVMKRDHSEVGVSQTLKASEFKARCLKLMDEVAESGKEIVITKNGRPISRLVPYRNKPRAPFGRDRDKIRILGDIVEPTGVVWEAEADPDRVLNP